MHFNTTATGKITGSVLVDGTSFTFKGSLDANGGFTKVLKAPSATRAAGIALHIQISTDGTKFDGTIGASALSGEKDKHTGVGEAGSYTASLGVNNLTASGGPLAGYLTLKISDTGAVTFKGFLPDGAKVTGASNVSITNKLPMVAGLYKNKSGFLSGLSNVLNDVGGTFRLTGLATWTKPPGSKGLYGTAGLSGVAVALDARHYVEPAAGSRVLPALDANGGAGTVDLSAGNLAAPIKQFVTVSAANKVSVNTPGADKLKLKIKAAKGTFSGTFMDGAKTRKIKGAFIQGSGTGEQIGTGYFLGTDVSGLVRITPN